MGAVDKIVSVREAMAVAMHGNAWGRASGKSNGAKWPAALSQYLGGSTAEKKLADFGECANTKIYTS